MKTDLYTKAILTLIASCLLYIVVKDVALVKDAHAQTGGVANVNIVQIGGRPINERELGFDGVLPVKVK